MVKTLQTSTPASTRVTKRGFRTVTNASSLLLPSQSRQDSTVKAAAGTASLVLAYVVAWAQESSE